MMKIDERLTVHSNAELIAGMVVACMPTLPKFAAEARSTLSSTMSRLVKTSETSSTTSRHTDPFQGDDSSKERQNYSLREKWEARNNSQDSDVPLHSAAAVV